MAKRNRIIVWSVIALLLILALIYAFRPQAVPVDLAPVSKGQMSLSVDEEGETRVQDVFQVTAPISGNMDRILLEPGDIVSADKTKLAALHPATAPVLDQRTEAQLKSNVTSAQSAVNAAKADIRSARSQYNLAAAERDRVKALFDRDFMSKAALDQAEAALQASQSALDAAGAALTLQNSRLQSSRAAIMPRRHVSEGTEHIDLTAVINGVVLKVMRVNEGPIAAGTPIMEIGDPGDLEVIADLLTEDAVRVTIGDKVVMSGWGGKSLQGHVRRIEPFAFTRISALGIEEQRVNVVIDFETAPDERLGHGFHTDISIIIWQEDDIITAPLTALFRTGNDWTAFVADNGRAEVRQIEVGVINGDRAQILDGLAEGEYVIEHPSGKIEDGVPIESR